MEEEDIGALGDQNDLSHLRTKLGFLAGAFSERISWMQKLLQMEERTWAGIGKFSDSSRLLILISHVTITSLHSYLSLCVVVVYLSSFVSPSHFPSWHYNFYFKTTLKLQRVKGIVLKTPVYLFAWSLLVVYIFPFLALPFCLCIFVTHLKVMCVCYLPLPQYLSAFIFPETKGYL